MPDDTSHLLPAPDCKIDEDRYRVFIEDISDGVYETDLEGNFIFFNNALCHILGRSREEIQNSNFRTFMDEENARIAFDTFNRFYRARKGASAALVWTIVRKDGERRTLEVSAKPILAPDGRRIGFRGIARDVTEKHRARKQILASEKLAREQYAASRRAEQRYRAFLNFLPDPVFVFNLDSTVSYLNPAFEKVFGWTLEELEGRRIPFVPESCREQTHTGMARLFKEKVIRDFETKRLTKDGRLLDIIIDGAVFYDENGAPAGQVITLRDVTRAKRAERLNRTLFRISTALHHYRGLDGLLAFVTREVQDLVNAGGALVILLDEEKKEFYFRAAAYDDSEAEKLYRETRFPADSKGVTGQVYKTGKPVIVDDYYKSPYHIPEIDRQTGAITRNMLQVPLWIESRLIGVLCAVNKKEGRFEQSDVELLTTIAGMVALPIENARINHALKESYEEVKSLNRAKDRVIHHLSHELKTPVSVLAASLELLKKKQAVTSDPAAVRIIERSRRNLQRILNMQYEIEDIIQQRDYTSHAVLTTMLDTCADELEVLIAGVCGETGAIDKIRQRIDALFGPKKAVSETIRLDRFVEDTLADIKPDFAGRRCIIRTRIEKTLPIFIPPEILRKVVTGLVRNAVENTPEHSRIDITVGNRPEGPCLIVADRGVGITEESRGLLFENYAATADTMNYATRTPYVFNAGGRGFDLLRMKIFSERYRFRIFLTSTRCRHIPTDRDTCPGDARVCDHCKSPQDCLASGGTTVTVQFPEAGGRQTESAGRGDAEKDETEEG